MPYRDLFDMNFPGVYLLHWAVLRALGGGDLAWRLFDLGLAGRHRGPALAPSAGRGGGVGAAGAALLFALYHLAGGAWQAGQRDFLLCLVPRRRRLGVARCAGTAAARGGAALGRARPWARASRSSPTRSALRAGARGWRAPRPRGGPAARRCRARSSCSAPGSPCRPLVFGWLGAGAAASAPGGTSSWTTSSRSMAASAAQPTVDFLSAGTRGCRTLLRSWARSRSGGLLVPAAPSFGDPAASGRPGRGVRARCTSCCRARAGSTTSTRSRCSSARRRRARGRGAAAAARRRATRGWPAPRLVLFAATALGRSGAKGVEAMDARLDRRQGAARGAPSRATSGRWLPPATPSRCWTRPTAASTRCCGSGCASPRASSTTSTSSTT